MVNNVVLSRFLKRNFSHKPEIGHLNIIATDECSCRLILMKSEGIFTHDDDKHFPYLPKSYVNTHTVWNCEVNKTKTREFCIENWFCIYSYFYERLA